MKVSEFIDWVSTLQARTGDRPCAVTLNNDDVRNLLDELQAQAVDMPVHPAARTRVLSSPPRQGFCMRLMGVDVFRSADVPRGEFRQD